MTEQIKSWKAERYRRQKIRDFKKSQKQIAKDLDIWCNRIKQATLQATYCNLLLRQRKKPYEHKSDKS